MSTLLEQASLVMIPSGYKEDVVYSQIPTDGSGDLSFTRASNGTRINSAGLVEVVPWNDVEYSEDFSNAYWTKDGATITTNSISAPNGTTTADKLDETSTSGVHRVGHATFPSGTQRTFSVYAKKAERNYVVLFENNSAGDTVKGVIFNLNTGTVSTNNDSSYYFNANIENLGNGWYRCSVNWTPTGLSVPSVGASLDGLTNSYSGTAGNGIYIWGAQLNIGSTAKPYFPTTDRLNVPRLTYQNGGGGCPSLLLEKQSTNFQTYSQDFTNVAWTKLGQGVGDTSVVTANYAISPDGTQNATRFVCNLNGGTTASDRSWMIANFTAQATSTISIWIKLNSAGTKTVLLSDSGGGTKTISGTDWQRIDATFVGAGGEFRIGLIGGSTSDTLDCCIWGAQAEAGSYPTSYIPTTSASATRVADACFKTGISSLIGQTEGVMFVDWNFTGNFDVSGILAIQLITGGSFAYIYINSSGSLIFELWDNGFQQSIMTSTIGAIGRKKMAFAYKQNDFAAYMNGTQLATDTSGTVGAMGSLYVGGGNTSNYAINGGINQAILFKTRLTNAELVSLTTI
jgi:hypothetical protein